MIPKFVICGIEHSGTTLLSDVFRQVPGLDSGFEVGVLLAKSPREFRMLEPFISNLKSGWGITDAQLDAICNTDNFDDFYFRLRQESRIVDDNDEIFDKTPRYFSQLQNCITRVPCKFIAVYKDPRSLVFSDYKRAKPNDFDQWFDDYAPKKMKYLAAIYKQYELCKNATTNRTTLVSLEAIALDTRKTFDRLFAFVDLEFKKDYLLLKNMRYKHTKETYVSSKIPFEYMEALNKHQEDKISRYFSSLNDWFYD